MKKLILILMLFPLIGNAQSFDLNNLYSGTVITDSVIWRMIQVKNIGDTTCKHEWVYADSYRFGGNAGCLVMHGGFPCDGDDQIQWRICKKCKRHELRSEFWYQHKEKKPETEVDTASLMYENATKPVKKVIDTVFNLDTTLTEYERILEDIALNDSLIRDLSRILSSMSMQANELITITTKILFQYEQECYNDSTRFEGAVYFTYKGEVIMKSNLYSFMKLRDTTFYTHKQPEFADFIKWLHKTLKK